MKLFRSPWTRVPDDEYIAKLRHWIEWWDRWRFWMILLYFGLLVVGIWVYSEVIRVLLGFAQQGNAPFILGGLVSGTVIGIGFGWMIHGLLDGMMSALGGFRAERLLLKLLDAHESEYPDPDQTPEELSESQELRERVNSW
jgi:hypothetical protein